jgi:hypothetical protein
MKPGWSKPVNLGMPLNDHHDQYSFIVSAVGNQGILFARGV